MTTKDMTDQALLIEELQKAAPGRLRAATLKKMTAPKRPPLGIPKMRMQRLLKEVDGVTIDLTEGKDRPWCSWTGTTTTSGPAR